MGEDVTIRQAGERDLAALGRLGGLLMRAHYGFDERRFLPPGDDPEDGYAWFLGTQLAADDTVVLVAERAGAVVGYVWAGVEPLSWKELRDEAGFVHDLVVAPEARRLGIARRLLDEAIEWFRARGIARVMLWTAHANADAQRVFEQRGFRRTMIEMTLNIEPGAAQ